MAYLRDCDDERRQNDEERGRHSEPAHVIIQRQVFSQNETAKEPPCLRGVSPGLLRLRGALSAGFALLADKCSVASTSRVDLVFYPLRFCHVVLSFLSW